MLRAGEGKVWGPRSRSSSWGGAFPGRVNRRAAQVLSTQLPPPSSEEMGFPGAWTGPAVTRGSTWMAEEVTQAPAGESEPRVPCLFPPPPPRGWAGLGLRSPGPASPGDGQPGSLGLKEPWSPPLCLDPWGLCDRGPHCVRLGQTVLFSVFTEGLRSRAAAPEGELGDGGIPRGLGPPKSSLPGWSCLHCLWSWLTPAPPFFSPFLWGSAKARGACISRN